MLQSLSPLSIQKMDLDIDWDHDDEPLTERTGSPSDPPVCPLEAIDVDALGHAALRFISSLRYIALKSGTHNRILDFEHGQAQQAESS